MPSIYLTEDRGAVVFVGGKPYTRNATNPVNVPSDTSPGAGDYFDIAAVTHALDDDGVSGGSAHRTWSGEQMAWALYGTGNKVEVDCPTAGTQYTLFTAPSAGVLRIWSQVVVAVYNLNQNTSASQIFVNTISVRTGAISSTAYQHPIRLNVGDVVTVALVYPAGYPGDYMKAIGIFCPYVRVAAA